MQNATRNILLFIAKTSLAKKLCAHEKPILWRGKILTWLAANSTTTLAATNWNLIRLYSRYVYLCLEIKLSRGFFSDTSSLLPFFRSFVGSVAQRLETAEEKSISVDIEHPRGKEARWQKSDNWYDSQCYMINLLEVVAIPCRSYTSQPVYPLHCFYHSLMRSFEIHTPFVILSQFEATIKLFLISSGLSRRAIRWRRTKANTMHHLKVISGFYAFIVFTLRARKLHDIIIIYTLAFSSDKNNSRSIIRC